MNQFQLFIDLNNAAFDNGNSQKEVARILKEVANKLETGGMVNHTDSTYVKEITSTLHDINGNPVGVAKFVS